MRSDPRKLHLAIQIGFSRLGFNFRSRLSIKERKRITDAVARFLASISHKSVQNMARNMFCIRNTRSLVSTVSTGTFGVLTTGGREDSGSSNNFLTCARASGAELFAENSTSLRHNQVVLSSLVQSFWGLGLSPLGVVGRSAVSFCHRHF